MSFIGSNITNSFLTNSEFTRTKFLAVGLNLTFFDSEFYQCNFIGIRPNYDSYFLDLEEIKNDIGKNFDKSVIKEGSENFFHNCIWRDFTLRDFQEIEMEENSAEKDWEDRYKLTEKNI